jgi:hypothetical protein
MSDPTGPRGSTTSNNGDDRVDNSVPAGNAVPVERPDDKRSHHDHDHDHARTDREVVVDREKEEFGGFKWGSAFFGWLTATGTAVLLTAILSAVGAGVGLGTNNGDVNDAAENVTKNGDVVGIVGAIVLAVILLVAYFCGGYVAGRMARFAGVKQGIAVWIWAVVIAIVVAVVAAIAGSQFNILGQLNSFPRIPIDEGTLTVTGIVTVAIVAVLSLVGAILGGIAGMRYHRKVDRVGLGR